MDVKAMYEQNKTSSIVAVGGFISTYFVITMFGGKPCTAFFTGVIVGVGLGVASNTEIAKDLRKQIQQSSNGKQ